MKIALKIEALIFALILVLALANCNSGYLKSICIDSRLVDIPNLPDGVYKVNAGMSGKPQYHLLVLE